MDAPTGQVASAPGRTGRRRGTAWSAGVALGAFAAVRGTGALVVALGAWWAGKDPVKVLGGSWDSFWYLSIAARGYGRTQMWPASDSIQSDYAFFPLYPLLVDLTGGGPVAGLVVSWTAAAAAAVGVYRLGELLLGARAGVLLVVLWASLPHAVVLGLAYTEPLLCALAAWSLYALLRGRWLWAASLAALAGLTRPTGIAVAAAVTVLALRELLVRGGREPRVWAAGLLAPAGWASYVLAVGAHRHDPLGYFAVQRQWGSRFDFGGATLETAWKALSGGPVTIPVAVTLAVLAAAALLAVAAVLERTPLPLLVYTATLLVITFGGAGFFESKPRFLLPAFPLLLPVAAAVARARPRTAVAVTAGLAGLSWGYGAYLLLMAEVPL